MLFLIFWCPVGKSDLAAPFWKLCFDHVPQPSSFWKNFYCSAKALAFFWTYLQLCTITHHHKRFADVISYIKEIEKNDLTPPFWKLCFDHVPQPSSFLKNFYCSAKALAFFWTYLQLCTITHHHKRFANVISYIKEIEKKKKLKKKKNFFFLIFFWSQLVLWSTYNRLLSF